MSTSTNPEVVRDEDRAFADSVEFADNPEPRCACVIVADTSGSMAGPKLAALEEGLVAFQQALLADELVALRVEVALVTFDSQVATRFDFTGPAQISWPALMATGQTRLGTGILTGLDLIEARKSVYRKTGVDYFRPWLVILTDGEPTEPESILAQARQRVREAEERKHACIFAVGVEGANIQRLAQLVVRPPEKLAGLQFAALFQWVSSSLAQVAHSKPGAGQVSLPPPGWRTT